MQAPGHEPRGPDVAPAARATRVNDPVFDLVLGLHVLCAVAGFGALGATGAYASAARRSPDPSASASLARFFSPGRNWGARAVLAVPVFGAGLLAIGHDAGRAYPWIGLAVWFAATGIASAVVWPGERGLQRLFAEGAAVPEGRIAELRALAARVERGAAATSLCFVLALVVMIAQPG